MKNSYDIEAILEKRFPQRATVINQLLSVFNLVTSPFLPSIPHPSPQIIHTHNLYLIHSWKGVELLFDYSFKKDFMTKVNSHQYNSQEISVGFFSFRMIFLDVITLITVTL